jgi:hypothetical protein
VIGNAAADGTLRRDEARAGEGIRIVPDPALPIGIGDHLVVIGERDPLQALAERSRAPGAA